MSQENVEIVREMCDAFNRRDVAAFRAALHPDGEWLLPRNLLEGGSYRGPDAVDRMLADAAESWDEATFEIKDIRDLDDQVLALGTSVNVGKDGGPRVEYQTGQLFTFREGKIAHLQPYLSHAEALEAVGLSE